MPDPHNNPAPVAMDICEISETWHEKDGDLVFKHSKVVLQSAEDDFFYATVSQRLPKPDEIDINALSPVRIPTEDIWPLADSAFTRAPDPLPSTCYLKRVNLLGYEVGRKNPDLKQLILSEIQACEILREHPHPNIVRYLGCVVKDGRVTRLVFDKHPTTLRQLLEDETSFDRARCLQGIEAGVRHMHDLGLVHNDLNPTNIMMNGDNPIIIDFDSCRPEGEKMGVKIGTEGWTLNGEEYAWQSNDLYSLAKIREALMGDEKER
ncbi:putative serine threonine kinase [Rosellinia necatrix]|uniref:Putative serine threonine kinase n=1 Tax=Rosellinia necatrix TaxID=77044 RepID=A0A1W2THF4_ROSNE|nr:putative serine threonine kinase [Rosellinia necatrix]